MSDRTLAILKTLAAFLVGYGAIQYATGYRYVITWDWIALGNGFLQAGLVNTQSPGLHVAMQTMFGPSKP